MAFCCRLWSDRSFLSGLLSEANHADLIFHCKDNQRVKAHQVVVLEQSTLLRSFAETTFAVKMRHSHSGCQSFPTLHVSLPDIRMETTLSLLSLLYTGRVEERSMIKVEHIKNLALTLGMKLNMKTSVRVGVTKDRIVQNDKEREQATTTTTTTMTTTQLVSTECQTDAPETSSSTSVVQEQTLSSAVPAATMSGPFVPSALAEAYYSRLFNDRERNIFPFGAAFLEASRDLRGGGSNKRRRELEVENDEENENLEKLRRKTTRGATTNTSLSKASESSAKSLQLVDENCGERRRRRMDTSDKDDELDADMKDVEVRHIEGHQVFACVHCERIFTLLSAARTCVKTCRDVKDHEECNDGENRQDNGVVNPEIALDNGARPRRSAVSKVNYNDSFPDF